MNLCLPSPAPKESSCCPFPDSPQRFSYVPAFVQQEIALFRKDMTMMPIETKINFSLLIDESSGKEKEGFVMLLSTKYTPGLVCSRREP